MDNPDCWQDLLAQPGTSYAPAGHRWTPLPDLAVLAFSGDRCGDFLQGYVTRDTVQVNPAEARFSATCDIRGRTTSNGWLIFRDDCILYRLHQGLREALAAELDRYAKFSRTTIASPNLLGAGVLGRLPELPEDAPPGAVAAIGAGFALRTFGTDCWELWLPPEAMASRLTELGPPVPGALWQQRAIAAGAVTIEPATAGQWLPQAWGAMHLQAVDFDKGCYLGQEVVARLQHRGQSKRVLCRLQQEKPTEAAPGATLNDPQGKPVGTIAMVSSGEDGVCALAVMKVGADPAGWHLSESWAA